jgi:hypothetical protein
VQDPEGTVKILEKRDLTKFSDDADEKRSGQFDRIASGVFLQFETIEN